MCPFPVLGDKQVLGIFYYSFNVVVLGVDFYVGLSTCWACICLLDVQRRPTYLKVRW